MRKGLAALFLVCVVLLATGCDDGSETADVPSDLEATVYQSCVILDWDESDNAEYYIVYRGTTSGDVSGKSVWASSLTATAYMDIHVTSGTTYYYQVTAVDSSGDESAGSAEVGVTAE
jgi:fibronectin type 3 domain-containing protein